jgi:hypothetical protein
MSGTSYEVPLPGSHFFLVYESLDDACVILGVFPRAWK